jgi:hypothetical protein
MGWEVGPLFGGCWHNCLHPGEDCEARREGKVFDITGGRGVLTMAAGREASYGGGG